MDKKVLVTGADGFIGQQTLKFLLEKGYKVHAVSICPQARIFEDGVSYYQCNLLDFAQQKELIAGIQPTHLLHFAWITTPGKYWTSLKNFRWVQASLELIMNFIRHGGYRFVGAGTCAEYDWSYGRCFEESTPRRPATIYGVCKNSLQEMLGSLSRQDDLSSAWGRIFFLYGACEAKTRLVPSVILSLLRGEPAQCTKCEQFRDFLYVEDVASAFVELLNSDIQGPVNIGAGKQVALKTIVEFIAKEIKREDLIKFGALPDRPGEPELLVADVDRLTKEVGWRPKYQLEEGLITTIDWWYKYLESA